MNVGAEDFRRHFEMLSDESLLETERDDLIPIAQECYDEELSRRGLDAGAAPEENGSGLSAVGSAEVETDELVLIATYLSGDEANLARGLLQSAEIPCSLAAPQIALGNVEIHLSVPASFAEHALEVLGDEISDEELAAQAEAAGVWEEEEPGEEASAE